MLVNCFAVYRKEKDKDAQLVQVITNAEEAEKHVKGLKESAIRFNMECDYYYAPYQLDIDEDLLEEGE